MVPTLADLFPSKDASGSAVLRLQYANLDIDAKDGLKFRPAVVAAETAKGRDFVPISTKLYRRNERHIHIPADYEHFASTGLNEASYILLERARRDIPKAQQGTVIGLLRGRLADEFVRRCPIPVAAVRQNPPKNVVWVWLKPWDYFDIEPRTTQQRAAVNLWHVAVGASAKVPPREARYDGRKVRVNPSTLPLFEFWVRAAAEWLYEHEASARDKREWAAIITRHPRAVRLLLLTYDAHVPLAWDREISDAEIERFVLAEVAVGMVARGSLTSVPPRMAEYVGMRVAPMFWMKARV